jgi:Tfp pilus assembly protein PilV
LIEVLIAMVILMVGLAAIAQLFAVAINTNSFGNAATGAATTASAVLQGLDAQPFGSLVPGGSLDSDVSAYQADLDLQGVGRIHSRWQIEQVDAQTLFIRVRSESAGRLASRISRSELHAFRSCTATAAPTRCPGL